MMTVLYGVYFTVSQVYVNGLVESDHDVLQLLTKFFDELFML